MVATVVVSVLAALGLPLRYDDDVVRFLPQDDPEVKHLAAISERFGSLHVALVGVETGDLFRSENLEYVRRLAIALRGVKAVASVTALTELAVVVPSQSGGGTHQDLVPQTIPTDDPALQKIKAQILGLDYLVDSVVSADGTSTQLICQLNEKDEAGERLGPKAAAEAVREAAEKVERPGSVNLHFGGAPFIAEAAANGSQRDLIRLAPYVCGIIVLLIFISLGSIRAALLALGSVGLGILWTMGIMGWLDQPLTLVSTSLPVILVALGSAYAVHLLVWYLDHDGDVEDMLNMVGWPVAIAALTTVAGFASFLVMNLEPMREFGWQMALGTGVCGLVSLIVLPAILVRWPIGGRSSGRLSAAVDDMLVGLAIHSRVQRALVLTVMAVVAVFFAWQLPDVQTRMDTRSFFEAGSAPDRADRFMTNQFGGSVFLQVLVTGDIRDPAIVRQMADFEDRIRAVPGVTRVESITRVLSIVHEALVGPRRPASTRKAIAYHGWLAQTSDPAVGLLVDEDWEGALLQVAIGGFDTDVVRKVTDAIRGLAKEHLPARVAVVARSERYSDFVYKDAAARILGLADHDGKTTAAKLAATLSVSARIDAEPIIAKATTILDAELGDEEDEEAMIVVRAGTDLKGLGRLLGGRLAHGKLDFAGFRLALTPSLDPSEAPTESQLRVVFAKLERLGGGASIERVMTPVLAALGKQKPPIRRRVEAIVSDLMADQWHVPASLAPEGTPSLPIASLVSGYPIVQEAMGRAVRANQINSLLASLPLVFLILCLVFRSVFAGLVGMVPTTLTLLVTFGLMGLFNERLPLDIGSSMLASIALGVGIDYAIHFLWRYRETGLRDAMRTTGRSIVINAVEITAGFVVLAGASIVPMSNFGLLTAETLLTAAVATLVLMPAIVEWWQPHPVPVPDLDGD